MIIGLSGFRGSGKDTVAAYLVKEHEFERRAFADPLKRSVAALFNIPFSDIDKMKNDPKCDVSLNPLVAMTFREFLQRYGTEAHRDVFGEDFWLEYTLPANGHYSGNLICITDLRFSNEAERIKQLGGRIWFINRITNRSVVDPHSSEIIDFGVDYTIDNTGTIEDLYVEVERALNVSIR